MARMQDKELRAGALTLKTSDHKDFYLPIVRYILQNYKQVSRPIQRRLEKGIRKCVEIRGFRDPLRAPPNQLIEEISRLPPEVGIPIVASMIEIWVLLKPELYSAVEKFLSTPNLPHFEDVNKPSDQLEILTNSQLDELVTLFQTEHSEFDANDVRLMICTLKSVVSVPQELAQMLADMETRETDTTFWVADDDDDGDDDDNEKPVWDRWLGILKSLSPEATEWDMVDDFIQQVRDIAEAKQAERATYGPLAEALNNLHAEVEAELQYFRMDKVENWTVKFVPTSEVENLSKQIHLLQEALQRHYELRHQPDSDIVTDTQRDDEKVALRNKIIKMYQELAAEFEIPFTSPEPDTGNEEAELSEEQADEVITPAQPLSEETPRGETSVEDELDEKIKPFDKLPVEGETLEVSGLTDKSEDETQVATVTLMTDSPQAMQQFEIDEESEPKTLLDEMISDSPSLSEPPDEESFVPSAENSTEDDQITQLAEADDNGEDAQDLPLITVQPQTARDIAVLLHAKDSLENRHAFLWALIAENDLPGAYWLARSLEATDSPCPVPHWLLAAVQGGQWLSFESGSFQDEFSAVVNNHPELSNEYDLAMGIAAVLRSILIVPHRGLSIWLKPSKLSPSLHEIVTAVSDFNQNGIALRPEDLLGVAGAEKREAAMALTVQQAKRWLKEAPNRRTTIGRGASIWQSLVGHRGELREMLSPVANDQRSAIGVVRQQLQNWTDIDYANKKISELDHELRRSKTQPIAQPVRQILLRGVTEACERAEEWCTLVEHEQKFMAGGSYLYDQIADLRLRIQKALPKVEAELMEIRQQQHLPSYAVATCLQRAIAQLREMLNLADEYSTTLRLSMNSWDWFLNQPDGLETTLANRLLWLPELSLDQNGLPANNDLQKIPELLSQSYIEVRSLHVAFKGWLQKQDYRFLETKLLSALSEEPEYENLLRNFTEQVAGAKAALAKNISGLEDEIEKAVLDGIIPEDSRGDYGTEALKRDETLNFAVKKQLLLESKTKLEQARQQRLNVLQQDWQELQTRMAEIGLSQIKISKVRTIIDRAFESKDTRVIEEDLARLRESLDKGTDPEGTQPQQRPVRNIIQEFGQIHQKIEEQLRLSGLQGIAKDIRDGRTQAEMHFGSLIPERRKEASITIEYWRRLKQQGASDSPNLSQFEKILRYLGFIFDATEDKVITLASSGVDWMHLRVLMSASDLARPIPQFGTETQGRYNVVCFWNRPGAGTISARLNELNLAAQGVLILYFDRLTLRQRRDLSSQKMQAALLDEVLLIFLAQERDESDRLPVFLNCALPFATLNPYKPFQAGNVPPEMFYGRRSMVEELQRLGGSCIVYGGRQLGKSALLRHVERQFHQPNHDQYAWVSEMKRVFDPAAGKLTNNVWRELRDRFKEAELISPRVRTEKPEEIRRHILQAFISSPGRRVLMMFDEADDFLDADREADFREVIAFRELMQETQNRFKVVFAGLHNVQRFKNIPNQPLAHFGTPVCVETLEPYSAQDLVREPLAALGYDIPHSLTRRILSYTNYHPGLIQLFCFELLKNLAGKSGNELPPYPVGQSDIEDVYRRIRDNIRERFDWTLALDMRYQAIAWALIEDQMKYQDSFKLTYPPAHILNLVRDWWPQGFSQMSLENLKGYLDEMRGLGVLVRNEKNGHFRLRSPNLVRLMGTEGDIANRLLELEDREPPAKPVSDDHHASLDDATQTYSPLTYAQENRLNREKFGVGLIFASEATGLSALPKALRRLVPLDLPEELGICTEIPISITTRDQLGTWLKAHLHKYSSHERLTVYYRPINLTSSELANLVDEAVSFCTEQKPQKRWLRVFFIFNERDTWNWLSQTIEHREDLENRADAYEFPQCWSMAGLRHRLERHDKLATDEICQEIQRVTGGWPFLLDELLTRGRHLFDLRSTANELETELKNPKSQLRQGFQNSLGLGVNDVIGQILKTLFQLQEGDEKIPAMVVTPELFDIQANITQADCDRSLEFLRRMGIIEILDDMITLSPVVGRVIT